jgi:hypothetical protein
MNEMKQGALVDGTLDAPILGAIVRAGARSGHILVKADAVEILFALLTMKFDDRLRLAMKLRSQPIAEDSQCAF